MEETFPRTSAALGRLRAALSGIRNEWRRAKALKLLARYQKHRPQATRWDSAYAYEVLKDVCGVERSA